MTAAAMPAYPDFFKVRADYFCKHLLGDYSQTVDIVEPNQDKGQSDEKRPGR
jgi:dipeptidyl-peptidase-4